MKPDEMVTITVPALDAFLAYACWEDHPDTIQNGIASDKGYGALVRVLKQLLLASGVKQQSQEFYRLMKENGFDT